MVGALREGRVNRHLLLGRPPRACRGRRPSAALRDYVLTRDDWTCRECGCSDAERRLDVDHIVPYSKGGATAEPNLRSLCWRCNNKKGAS